jgi:hypothetical protein
MTFGMIGLLGWACVDPPGFAIVMSAPGAVPEVLWAVWGAMVAFWFGARELHKVRDWKFDKAILRAATEAARTPRAVATPAALSAASGRNAATAERALAATIWGEARGESEEGKLAWPASSPTAPPTPRGGAATSARSAWRRRSSPAGGTRRARACGASTRPTPTSAPA